MAWRDAEGRVHAHYMGYWCVCRMCGVKFRTERYHALTCTPACRQMRARFRRIYKREPMAHERTIPRVTPTPPAG